MKKNFFLLAATTMMFAACAQNDLVDETVVKETTPQAIGFETFAQKATRAEITKTADLTSFQVWGYKSADNWATSYTVFNNVKVSLDGAVWKYDDPQYWDKMSIYNFYAAAPAEPAENDYSISNGMITIKNVNSAISTSSQDYLIVRNGATNISGAYTGTHDEVKFDFNHIMSKVSFQFKSAIAEEIVVTSVKMTGWNSGVGKFEQKQTATPSNTIDVSEWSFTSTDSGNIQLVGGSSSDKDGIKLNSDKTTTTPVKDSYIMVPQSIAENTLTFTIDYKIGDETFVGHVGVLPDAQTWGTDTHTTYTITVGPDVIDFAVNSVISWTNPGSGSVTIE